LDRGYDFAPLVKRIQKSQIQHFVFFPESGEKMFKMLQADARSGDALPQGCNRLFTSSMEEAVKFAYQHTSGGKICLLSSASPSYSVWKNFEEKGDLFQKRVKKLGEG
jgi:UDP-N-acetylmuramoylalanine--D-glutamate ligase